MIDLITASQSIRSPIITDHGDTQLAPSVTAGFAGTSVTSGFNPTHTAATQAQTRCQSSPGTIDHSINIRFIFRFSINIRFIFRFSIISIISIISIVGLKPDAIDPIIDHHRSWRHTAGIIGNVGFCRHIGNVGFQPDAHSDAHNDDAATDAHSDTGTDAASASATASAPSVTSGFNPTRRDAIDPSIIAIDQHHPYL